MYMSLFGIVKGQRGNLIIAVALLGVLLAAVACSETSPTKGKWFAGDTLQMNLVELRRTAELRYPGNDGSHYLVAPTSPDNELVMVRLDIRNARASKALFTIDSEAAELHGSDYYNEVFVPIDIDAQRVDATEADSAERRFARPEPGCPTQIPCVLFLRGPVELPQNFGLLGWLVFEIPKGIELTEFKWQAGDTIYMRF